MSNRYNFNFAQLNGNIAPLKGIGKISFSNQLVVKRQFPILAQYFFVNHIFYLYVFLNTEFYSTAFFKGLWKENTSQFLPFQFPCWMIINFKWKPIQSEFLRTILLQIYSLKIYLVNMTKVNYFNNSTVAKFLINVI